MKADNEQSLWPLAIVASAHWWQGNFLLDGMAMKRKNPPVKTIVFHQRNDICSCLGKQSERSIRFVVLRGKQSEEKRTSPCLTINSRHSRTLQRRKQIGWACSVHYYCRDCLVLSMTEMKGFSSQRSPAMREFSSQRAPAMMGFTS